MLSLIMMALSVDEGVWAAVVQPENSGLKNIKKSKRNPQVPLGVSGLSASAVVTAVEAVEQALHEIAVLVVEALAVAQQDRRIVRELVGEAVGEHLQDLLGAVAVMEVAQGRARARLRQEGVLGREATE